MPADPRSYQMTLPALMADHTRQQSEGIMRSAVHIASEAAGTSSRQVGLSLGPFGATLRPGQEYAGIYPPPYGPAFPSSTERTNAFPSTADGQEAQQAAVEALAQFHLERLRVFAEDEDTWRKVDWVAFETVPVLHEVRGIRLAMGILHEELSRLYEQSGNGGREWWDKRFWITCPFPDGSHPQLLPVGGHATVDDLLSALLSPVPGARDPDGVGINCTHPSHLVHLLTAFTNGIGRLKATVHPEPDRGEERKPWFVLYPDGGATYDVVSRTWTTRSFGPEGWASEVASAAKELVREDGGVWGGVIVGGCCKAGFEEIGALRKELDRP
jgi:homocysteine S-methyltransferase